ncbi:MAG: hypothetical protein LBI94_07955 [Treponema sp.]|jgi:hypothetical protein|nr:hypothetical protein [Treponema sp.]
MLGKLLRHEFKALLRFIPVLYLALLGLAVAAGVSGRTTGNWGPNGHTLNLLKQSPIILYSILLFGQFVVNLGIVIQRFRDNFLKDEGYLMFTLPVPEWKLAASKAIAALCVFLLTGAAAVLSLLICGFIGDSGNMQEALSVLWVRLSATGPDRVIFGIATVLVGIFQQLCLIYASMTASQLVPRFRGLVGFGVYAVVMFVVEEPITRAVFSLNNSPVVIFFLEAAFAALYLWCVSWLLKHTFNLE